MRCNHCGGRFSSRYPSCKGCGAPKTAARVGAEVNRSRRLASATEFFVAERIRRRKREREDMEADEAKADAFGFGLVSVMLSLFAVLICLNYPPLFMLLLPTLLFLGWE